MQRGRVGYTTLTICQPLYKTSRKSFHCDKVGGKKPDMNKQFLLTLLYFFLYSLSQQTLYKKFLSSNLSKGVGFEDNIQL